MKLQQGEEAFEGVPLVGEVYDDDGEEIGLDLIQPGMTYSEGPPRGMRGRRGMIVAVVPYPDDPDYGVVVVRWEACS